MADPPVAVAVTPSVATDVDAINTFPQPPGVVAPRPAWLLLTADCLRQSPHVAGFITWDTPSVVRSSTVDARNTESDKANRFNYKLKPNPTRVELTETDGA